MGKEQTEKSPYKSRFGGGWISPDKYLAENMCDRMARSQNTTLPELFWREKHWANKFVLQVKHANDLLEKYDITAITAALRHPDGKRVYSLGFKSVLIPLIELEQKKIQTRSEQQIPTIIEKVDTYQKPRQPFAIKKNTLQKIRELDNG